MPVNFDARDNFDRFGLSGETISLAPHEAVAFAREWDRMGWGLLCGGNEYFRGDWVSNQGRTIEQGFDSLELAASVSDRFWVASESGRRVSALVVVR
jgi:hypothetical protein